MLVYTSNSPEYLNYIASTYTRNEIENDEKLCVLLNNEYIKDNMEIAISYVDAEWGDYQDKINFVERFFCTGPELDVDTLSYYRTKILLDDTYSEIANYYFYDINTIDNIRGRKYGKKKDLDNCFTSPCNYLGKFGAGIGLMGDYTNFKNLKNTMAAASQPLTKEEMEGDDPADLDVVVPNKNKDGSPESSFGYIKRHLRRWFLPETNEAIEAMNELKDKQAADHVKRLKRAGVNEHTAVTGDAYAPAIADCAATVVKANVKRSMGDCARLWEQARRLNIFDSSQNGKTPMNPSKETPEKRIDGTAKQDNQTVIQDESLLVPPSKKEENLTDGAWVQKYSDLLYKNYLSNAQVSMEEYPFDKYILNDCGDDVYKLEEITLTQENLSGSFDVNGLKVSGITKERVNKLKEYFNYKKENLTYKASEDESSDEVDEELDIKL